MIARIRHGLSLVELLVVIVIISILSALVLPSFKNVLSERKTNVAALEVKSFLEAARARAIARGRNVSVIFERLSSRWDGASSSPRLSMTADNNVSNASPLDINYSQYNTCIRMTMAETLKPTEYSAISPPILAASSVNVGVAPNVKLVRQVNLRSSDQRLQIDIAVGNEIEFLDSDGRGSRFVIQAVGPIDTSVTPPIYSFYIANPGSTQLPYGTLLDVEDAANNQRVLKPFIDLSTITSNFRIYSIPKPLASVTNELPRGTCIDLSVSGLASDDNLANRPKTSFTNCQRQFASDWASPLVPPTPQQLRPVYITFSPNGNVESIMSNAPLSPSLQRIEPNQDIFLFVGRTDQVVLPLDVNTGELNAKGIGDRRAEGAKPNMLDPTGYWVRISATNGSVAAAPTQAWHVENDVNEAMEVPPTSTPDDLGEMITESRALTFQSELSSQ
jgi:prepilin-type N-terminal cleavage/methylation domain-containing protein